MDRFIATFDAAPDADLMLCSGRGVAYQADMTAARVSYDADYLAKVEAYEGGEIARTVNAGRCAMLVRHLAAGAAVLDVGAGTGAFVRAARECGFDAKGFDVNRTAQARLWAADLDGRDDPAAFDAVTLWDSIEHCEEPAIYLGRVRVGAYLFASIPVFDDLDRIRESKHYRPGEHLYYWTPSGFVDWMALYGFRLLEQSSHEIAAGRESIGAFAFCRDFLAT